MNLSNAISNTMNSTKTTNGMGAYKNAVNACLDLFYKIGGSRGRDIIPLFSAAFSENQDIAVRIALWARDAREGAGERQLFRDIFAELCKYEPNIAKKLIPLVPELGRWDDLLVGLGTSINDDVIQYVAHAIANKNGLCAKWMPRKGAQAVALRTGLRMSPKQYRKTLVNLTNVVETNMCQNKWSSIEYAKVPSLASARYQKAFGRHDSSGYTAYVNSLVKGETKINAGAVYPYDIIKSVRSGNEVVANEQWKALPNFVPDNIDFLPMIDVSGSMCTPVSGGTTAMDVAISLGIYLAERCKGQFNNQFLTFTDVPKLVKLSGSLKNRYVQTNNDVGYNTNIEGAFKCVLNAAIANNLSQEDLPTHVLILSDMQFDAANSSNNDSCNKMINDMYRNAGYTPPVIVYWNLCGKDNVPISSNAHGNIMVSGFSPSIMRSIVGGTNVTPLDILNEAVGIDRYKWNV